MENHINNSMHNTDNPVTLFGLNSKLIFRGLLFYAGSVTAALLVAQFLMSLLTVNLSFYFEIIPTVKGIAYLFLLALFIEILIKAALKAQELSTSELPSNTMRDSLEILKTFSIRKVKWISFLLGIIMIPFDLLFLFSSKGFETSDQYSTVRDVLYHNNVMISNNYYFLFAFITVASWIYLSTKKSVYENEIVNREDFEINPESIKELHNAVISKDWENKVLKLLFKPVYHDLIRVYKLEERYQRPGTNDSEMQIIYDVYAETVSGIPLRPTNILVRFYEETSEKLMHELDFKTYNDTETVKAESVAPEVNKELKDSKSKVNLHEISEAISEKQKTLQEQKSLQESRLQELKLVEKRDERAQFGKALLEKRKPVNSFSNQNFNKKQRKGFGKVNPRKHFNRKG